MTDLILPTSLTDEIRHRIDTGEIDFTYVGEPIAQQLHARLEVLLMTLDEVLEARHDRRASSELVSLLTVAQQGHLLAQHDLPHTAFPHLLSYAEALSLGPPGNVTESEQRQHQTLELFGLEVRDTLGVGASVLTASAAYVDYLFALGHGVVTFKTVRSMASDAYPTPNWAFVPNGELASDPHLVRERVVTNEGVTPPRSSRVSTVNSYGVPSPDPDIWMSEYAQARSTAAADQLLIASVMGSYDHFTEWPDLVDDFARVAELAVEAGAPVVELNLSCPNVLTGDDRQLLCERPDLVEEIVKSVRNRVQDRCEIVLKLSSLPASSIRELVGRTGREISGLSGINTVGVDVRRDDGSFFFQRLLIRQPRADTPESRFLLLGSLDSHSSQPVEEHSTKKA